MLVDATLTLYTPGTALGASLAVVLLAARRVGLDTAGRAGGDALQRRLQAGWWLLPPAGLALLAGTAGVMLLAAALSFLSLRADCTQHLRQPGDHRTIAWMFYAGLPLQYALVASGEPLLYGPLLPLALLVLHPLWRRARGGRPGWRQGSARPLWGLLVCGWGLSHLAALAWLPSPEGGPRALLLVAYLLLVLQGSDLAQQLWRQWRPQAAGDGLLAGLAGAALTGAALAGLTPYGPLPAALAAVALRSMGELGLWARCALRRDDAPAELGPHGLLLERLEPVACAAPLLLHLVLRHGAGG